MNAIYAGLALLPCDGALTYSMSSFLVDSATLSALQPQVEITTILTIWT